MFYLLAVKNLWQANQSRCEIQFTTWRLVRNKCNHSHVAGLRVTRERILVKLNSFVVIELGNSHRSESFLLLHLTTKWSRSTLPLIGGENTLEQLTKGLLCQHHAIENKVLSFPEYAWLESERCHAQQIGAYRIEEKWKESVCKMIIYSMWNSIETSRTRRHQWCLQWKDILRNVLTFLGTHEVVFFDPPFEFNYLETWLSKEFVETEQETRNQILPIRFPFRCVCLDWNLLNFNQAESINPIFAGWRRSVNPIISFTVCHSTIIQTQKHSFQLSSRTGCES